MNNEQLSKLMALTEVSGIGNKRALKLYQASDTVDDIYRAGDRLIKEFHFVDDDTLSKITELDSVIKSYQQQFAQCEADNIDVIDIEDPRYPEQLRDYHAPIVIYAKGNAELLQKQSISFAGSRETNQPGREWTTDVAKELANDYVIVSGGAIGADTAAHRGALSATGQTIVVLGTGINNPYPEENTELFEDIIDAGGLLISHQEPSASPSRHSFLYRNKTNSGLSQGIIVVATDGSGGTMSQYRDSKSQNKHIFVPPPELGFEPVDGIRQLITEDAVEPVTRASDVISHLSNEKTKNKNEQTSLDSW